MLSLHFKGSDISLSIYTKTVFPPSQNRRTNSIQVAHPLSIQAKKDFLVPTFPITDIGLA